MVMAGTQKPMQTPEAQELLKDSARLREMLSSPEVRRLAELLNARSGGGLRQVAQSAKGGDTAQLEQLMQGLSSTEEGARLIAQLQGKMGK